MPFATLHKICERITELGGNYHLLPIHSLSEEEENKIIDSFLAQSNLQYDEIIENCQINFTKEIEFETFRQNFTYAEAEEIRQEFDKMRRWYDRVVERDWFVAVDRDEALRSIENCKRLLESFEEKVFLKQEENETHDTPPVEGKKHLHPRRLERRSTPPISEQ